MNLEYAPQNITPLTFVDEMRPCNILMSSPGG